MKMSFEMMKKIRYSPQYFEHCKYLWQNHVPDRGQSDVLQAELLREIEGLRWEAQENGNINWDLGFEIYCRNLLLAFCGIKEDEEGADFPSWREDESSSSDQMITDDKSGTFRGGEYCFYSIEEVSGLYDEDEKARYRDILMLLRDRGRYARRFHNQEIPDDEVEVERIAWVDDNLYDILCDAVGKLQANHPSPILWKKDGELWR